jgi:plasmid stabilization system protein ParE
MGWKIDWTQPALDDLGSIVRYIAKNDPEIAQRVGDKIVDHVGALAQFPEISPVFEDALQRTCDKFCRFRIASFTAFAPKVGWLKFSTFGTAPAALQPTSDLNSFHLATDGLIRGEGGFVFVEGFWL